MGPYSEVPLLLITFWGHERFKEEKDPNLLKVDFCLDLEINKNCHKKVVPPLAWCA